MSRYAKPFSVPISNFFGQMKQPGGRSFAFISGFMIGMLTALGVAFLLMNNFDPFSFSIRGTFNQEADTVVNKSSEINQPERKTIKELLPETQQTYSDSIIPAPSDSNVSVSPADYAATDELIIRRDEMIVSRTMEAARLNTRDQGKLKNDSLLRQLTEAPATDINRYKVEYWRSPVNFRGYKLIRNSLIIFGLSPDIPASLQQSPDYLLLKYGNQTFKLTPVETFEPLPKPSVD